MPSIAGWYRPTLETSCVVIRSLIYDYDFHYIDNANHTARCLGSGCELCDVYPTQHSYIVAVSPAGSKVVKLLEMRPRHSELVDRIRASGESIIGIRLYVAKEEEGKHSAIEVHTTKPRQSKLSNPEAKADVTEVYISKYVQAIGYRQYCTAKDMLSYRANIVEE